MICLTGFASTTYYPLIRSLQPASKSLPHIAIEIQRLRMLLTTRHHNALPGGELLRSIVLLSEVRTFSILEKILCFCAVQFSLIKQSFIIIHHKPPYHCTHDRPNRHQSPLFFNLLPFLVPDAATQSDASQPSPLVCCLDLVQLFVPPL